MKHPSNSAAHHADFWQDDEEMRWSVRQWATRIGVKELRVRFRMLDAQWGTLTPSGWLTLDSTLLRLPRELGEDVIVHELVHLLAPNHGRLFKRFLHASLPDWEARAQRLQAYAQGNGKG